MAPVMDHDDDLVGTISDNEIVLGEAIEAHVQPKPTKRKRDTAEQRKSALKKQKREDDKASDVDSDFEFGLEDTTAALDDWDAFDAGGKGSATKAVDVDELIVRRRQPAHEPAKSEDDSPSEIEDGDTGGSDFEGFGAGADLGEEDSNDDNGRASDHGSSASENGVVKLPESVSDVSEEAVDALEEAKQKAYFSTDTTTGNTKHSSFNALHLSRPILKGLASLNFSAPTPIQSKAIPVALEGKDVVGGAVTGSGKTGAFMIPILERLMYRPRRTATTRVAILMPTRELALQCFNVAKKLASFTDITFGLAVGGLNIREQEKQLKLRPDIVIATPGRFIDLERNSSSFTVGTVEILVLDEADRMLEEGFADELNEILTKIPKSRQTMLFSATMTSKVDDLIRVGLQRPVRLMVDPQRSTVQGLVQEFVRLRPGRETKRLAYLMYLCQKVHTDRALIFFRQKKEAHRVRIMFGLCGMKAAELHGSMSQEQRIQAIEAFRTNRASFLLATDLASRGLDIKGIETVINYEAPQSHEIYLHRVGRTARAGRTGRSCTIAAEPDRKVVKAAVKAAKAQGAQIRQRTVAPEDVDAWETRCEGLEDDIEAILREEKEEKALVTTERQLSRADNIVEHREEIMARPKKTWFESEKDKLSAKHKGSEALNGPSDAPKEKSKKRKLSNKQKKQLDDRDERRDGRMWKKGKTDRKEGGKR